MDELDFTNGLWWYSLDRLGRIFQTRIFGQKAGLVDRGLKIVPSRLRLQCSNLTGLAIAVHYAHALLLM